MFSFPSLAERDALALERAILGESSDTLRKEFGGLESSLLMYNICMSDKKIYECPACGLHYYDEEIVNKCEAWCTQNKSCNLEFIEHSLESQKQHKQTEKNH